MAFDIQFWKQCCSVKHDRRNFNYVSFESILIGLFVKYLWSIVIHPSNLLAAFHCFMVLEVSGTHWTADVKLPISPLQHKMECLFEWSSGRCTAPTAVWYDIWLCSHGLEFRSESCFRLRSKTWLGSWFELRAFTCIANACPNHDQDLRTAR